MKKLLFITAITTMFFSSCSNAQAVVVTEFEKGLSKSVQLVDVRSQEEYDEGHIPGATLIDVNDDDFEKNITMLEKDKPVYVYCHSGRRSKRAGKMLKENGFKHVVDLNGGIEAWKEAGKKIETSAN